MEAYPWQARIQPHQESWLRAMRCAQLLESMRSSAPCKQPAREEHIHRHTQAIPRLMCCSSSTEHVLCKGVDTIQAPARRRPVHVPELFRNSGLVTARTAHCDALADLNAQSTVLKDFKLVVLIRVYG